MGYLSKRAEEAEPSYLQRNTIEHFFISSHVIPIAASYLRKKLIGVYGLEEEVALSIVNLFPEVKEEIEEILQIQKTNLTDAKVEEILQFILPFKDSSKEAVMELIGDEVELIQGELEMLGQIGSIQETREYWEAVAAEEEARRQEELEAQQAAELAAAEEEYVSSEDAEEVAEEQSEIEDTFDEYIAQKSEE